MVFMTKTRPGNINNSYTTALTWHQDNWDDSQLNKGPTKSDTIHLLKLTRTLHGLTLESHHLILHKYSVLQNAQWYKKTEPTASSLINMNENLY